MYIRAGMLSRRASGSRNVQEREGTAESGTQERARGKAEVVDEMEIHRRLSGMGQSMQGSEAEV
jgi:hypothetical protein